MSEDRSVELWGEDRPITAIATKIAGATHDHAGTSRSKAGKAAKAVGRLLHKKTIERYEVNGFFAFSVDSTTASYGGAVYSADLLGVADIMAVGTERLILVQSTTEGRETSHTLKYIKPDNIDKRTGRSAFDNLMRWFALGGEFEMACWSQERKGAAWTPKIVNLDREWFVARRAKYESRGDK